MLLLAFAVGIGSLIVLGLLIIARRWYVERRAHSDALHVRLLRSELMQAVARGEDGFLIEHWTTRDRTAALTVASQILTFLKGPDRRRLEEIVERNGVLRRPLARIARLLESRRIATIRQLAAFGNQSVQATLHSLLKFDPSSRVRLEAAIAILVAGSLPSPWRVLRSVLTEGQAATPNHRLLFRTLALTRVEAVIAMATLQEDKLVRQLALDALGHALDPRALQVLQTIADDDDDELNRTAQNALAGMQVNLGAGRHDEYAAAAKVRRLAMEQLAA